ncbi:MFS transporter [Actinoplanes sp. NPDC051859]|uniref:MFS transporter n=1 Tax=Actinoplanes sp. NPDC051859 TaxID=3363909 RepID=UPI003787F879
MRNFRLLTVGNAVSSYGSFLSMVALSLFAFHLTGSALQTGLFMALRLATSFVAGLLAGGLVSRLDRKRLMVGADLTQAVALAGLVAAPVALQSSLLYGVAVVTGACGTLSAVALRSSVPAIVGPDQRIRANALLVTGRSIAMVAGFASAGLVVSTLGFTAALLIDAATFLFSAVNLVRLPLTTREAPAPDAETPPGLLTAQRLAIGFLRGTPILLAMIALRAIDGFGSAAHNVGLPVLSSTLDPAHPATFMAQFWTSWAVGNIVAQRVVARWLSRGARSVSEWAFGLGAALMSGAFILAFTTPPLILGVLIAVVAGIADGFTEIAYTSRLQAAPDVHRGYVFGFSAMVENIGFGTGMVLSAALLERSSPLAVVATFHGTAVALALIFLGVLALRRRRRPAEPLPVS